MTGAFSSASAPSTNLPQTSHPQLQNRQFEPLNANLAILTRIECALTSDWQC